MPTDNKRLSRRRLIQLSSLGVGAGLAGCTGGGPESDGGSDDDGSGGQMTTNGGGTDGESDGTLTPVQERVRLSGESPGSGTPAYLIFNGAAKILDDNGSNIRIEVGTSSSSAQALRLMGRGDVQLAQAAVLFGAAAYHELNPIESINYAGDQRTEIKPLQAFNAFTVNFHWITRNPEIQTMDDLAGRTVSVAGPGAAPVYNAIFHEIGILGDFETVNTTYDEMAFALEEGRIDAGPLPVLTGGVTPGWVEQMKQWDDAYLVEYTDEHAQMAEDSQLLDLERNNLVNQTGFKNSFDLGGDNETPVVQMAYNIYYSQTVQTGTAYELTRLTMENNEQLQELAPPVGHLTPETAAGGLSSNLPVHPGAAAWYQENNLWRDELTVGDLAE